MGLCHRKLKRMLHNSGGLSLLCGRLGVQGSLTTTPQMATSIERGGMSPRGPCVDKGL